MRIAFLVAFVLVQEFGEACVLVAAAAASRAEAPGPSRDPAAPRRKAATGTHLGEMEERGSHRQQVVAAGEAARGKTLFGRTPVEVGNSWVAAAPEGVDGIPLKHARSLGSSSSKADAEAVGHSGADEQAGADLSGWANCTAEALEVAKSSRVVEAGRAASRMKM